MTQQPPAAPPARTWKLKWFVLTAAVAAAASFGLALLVTTMFHRKNEALNPYVRLVEVTDNTTDPAQWGKNWPRQHDAYLRTVTSLLSIDPATVARWRRIEALARVAEGIDPAAMAGVVATAPADQLPSAAQPWRLLGR